MPCELLRKRGFAFDVFNPSLSWHRLDPDRWSPVKTISSQIHEQVIGSALNYRGGTTVRFR